MKVTAIVHDTTNEIVSLLCRLLFFGFFQKKLAF